MNLASIPSPARGVWHLGPLPVRAYAFCIIAGVVLAVWLGEKRWVARGGRAGDVTEIATWMVPMGILGGRIYHVITSPQAYFGAGGDPIKALYIWQGGLGIWGAVALGGVGAWIGCRRRGIPLPPFADALAPGIVLAQAVGRFGNYFNQELYGRPTDLPWGLEIDPAHRPDGLEDRLTFQPTFLYESIWDVGVAGLVIWADRRFKLGHGRAFALYVAAYTVGRFWIEDLRVDPANHFLGLRLNDWTSILVFVGAVTYFVLSARRHPGREVVTGGGEPGSAPDEPDSSLDEPSGAPASSGDEPESPGAKADPSGEQADPSSEQAESSSEEEVTSEPL
jgi:prolipoprotein diacylglyceryl transferase